MRGGLYNPCFHPLFPLLHTQEIASTVTAKFDKLDPTPANAVYCPPGYFSANTTGPCEVCGLGFWCPGGYQSTPRRVQVKRRVLKKKWVYCHAHRYQERANPLMRSGGTIRDVSNTPCMDAIARSHLPVFTTFILISAPTM